MKKVFLLMVCMLAAISIAASAVDASPTPNLSNLKITHIGNNTSGNMFVPADHDNVIYGAKVLLKVRYVGYPNFASTFLYQNRALIGPVNKFETGSQNIVDSNDIVTGYIKTYTINSSKLPGNKFGYLGNFFVKAVGIKGGDFSSGVYDVTLK